MSSLNLEQKENFQNSQARNETHTDKIIEPENNDLLVNQNSPEINQSQKNQQLLNSSPKDNQSLSTLSQSVGAENSIFQLSQEQMEHTDKHSDIQNEDLNLENNQGEIDTRTQTNGQNLNHSQQDNQEECDPNSAVHNLSEVNKQLEQANTDNQFVTQENNLNQGVQPFQLPNEQEQQEKVGVQVQENHLYHQNDQKIEEEDVPQYNPYREDEQHVSQQQNNAEIQNKSSEQLRVLQQQNVGDHQQVIEGLSNTNVKEELQNVLNQNSERYARLTSDVFTGQSCHFLGGKSLQLTNINDACRLFYYFLGTKIPRQLLKKANQNLHEIHKPHDIKEFTLDEIQVFQALKIVMGLQQNSSNFEFFLLQDLQKIPPYTKLFTNERFQFLLECEKELNKDIINNEQLTIDFVSRAQNAMTSDQELVLISKMKNGDIVHNNTAYTQIYLCELSSSFIFGYYIVKDINQFVKQALINLENYTNYNHHIYLQSEEFLSNLSKIKEFKEQKIHFSTFLPTLLDEIPQEQLNQILPPDQIKENHSEIIFDRETNTQFLLKFDENKKRSEVFATTNGTSKLEKMQEKHKQAVQKMNEKLHKQLVEYRFLNINDQYSIFEELSEIAIQNSYIIYSQAKEKTDYRQFRLKLAMELLSKQIQKIKTEEQLDKKQKLVDVEVQTDKLQDKQIISPEKQIPMNPLKPVNPQQVAHQQNVEHVSQFQVGQQPYNNTLHVQRKEIHSGFCFACKENNLVTTSDFSCTECSTLQKQTIYLCERCFDPFHKNLNFGGNFDKNQPFSKLSALKSSLSNNVDQQRPLNNGYNNPIHANGQPIPPNGQPPIPQNNGYGPIPQQQIPGRRGRRPNNFQDGYETSGAVFGSQMPNGLGGPHLQLPLKRKGPALEDGFRSDAPQSNYLAGQRGRRRQIPNPDYNNYDMMGPNNGYGQNMGGNNFNYDRQRPVDMNGYTTADNSYGRQINNGYGQKPPFIVRK